MTIRTNALQECDRCQKPFNEKNLKSGDAVPVFKQSGLVITETTGTSKDSEPKFKLLVSFDDLCPECRTAVDNLIAKIRLDSKPSKKKSGVRKKRSTSKKDEKPTVPEYSEDKAKDEAKAKDEKPAEKPGPDGEPAESKGEATEGAEEKAPEAKADGGNGTGAEPGPDGLITDPETGDKYDPATGEVVEKGAGKVKDGEHPF